MSKTWVKTDYVPERHKDLIKAGKWYLKSEEGWCTFEGQEDGYILENGCAFLDFNSWTVYKGDTPPVEETKEEDVTGDTNSIGKISGADWSKAPSGATHVDITCRGNFYVKEEGNWRCFWGRPDKGTFVSGTFPNGDSLNGEFGQKLISKEDDLLIVPKHSKQ